MDFEFDEIAYLKINPDIADLIAKGDFKSGLDHFLQFGQQENRLTNFNSLIKNVSEVSLSLREAFSEHNTKIALLTKVLAERDEEIGCFRNEISQIIIEKDNEINILIDSLHNTFDWRLKAILWNTKKHVLSVSPSLMLKVLKKLFKFKQIRQERALESIVCQIRASSLFNEDYYLSAYPDVATSGIDPVKHYYLYGWKENRKPSAAFNTAEYLFDNPDVAKAGINPLEHYLKHGLADGRSLKTNTLLIDDMHDFVTEPMIRDLYLEDNEGIKVARYNFSKASIDAEIKDIRISGLFDESFYLSMYPDLPSPLDPVRHYCEQGWHEGRNPSDEFDTRFYLKTYSDIRKAGINPFWHFATSGAREFRHALPELSIRHENEIWFDKVNPDVQLIALYVTPDWPSLSKGRPLFKGHFQPILPEAKYGFYNPLDAGVLSRQAYMAKAHGINGFCFNLYVGKDEVIDQQPIEVFLEHDEIDIQFCLQVELFEHNQVLALAKSLGKFMKDPRQIRNKNRPVLLISEIVDMQYESTLIDLLRRLLIEYDVGNPFFIGRTAKSDMNEMGKSHADLYDAMLDLPKVSVRDEIGNFVPVVKNGADVVPYSVVASNGVFRAKKEQSSSSPVYPVITLARDNTTQKLQRPMIYTRFQLSDYRSWLDAALTSIRLAHPENGRYIFMNAWNDWNEGLFLEPDRQGGFSRLNETSRALLNINSNVLLPKVSVIVPNYNHEQFLRHRLDSIYSQSYKNIDVILLDDRSSDQSRSILEEYAAKYPKVTRTFFNDNNSGSAFRQWSKGIKAAKGDLVWIAESDDFCDVNFLETLVRCFDDQAVMLAYAKSVFVDKDENLMEDEFQKYVSDLDCAERWTRSYVETAHKEVRCALGIKNTIPNASGVLFRRHIDMPLLEDESWLSMRVAGDWVFYLHILRGGKIAYRTDTTNFFRRYKGSAAETTYKTEIFYREVGLASRTVAALYNVPLYVLEDCRNGYNAFYGSMVGVNNIEFLSWYNYQAVLEARESRLPNIMVSTMGFYPGGAEILPIRLVNEFKRLGLAVILLSADLNPCEDGVRRMLRNDVPLIETSNVEAMKAIIKDFGVEVLNTHQWHIQKYPLQVPDVFARLSAHVASLHGMIEHGEAFGATVEQLRKADDSVTTWVYTAEKNLVPFSQFGLYNKSSKRFAKMPNGMQPSQIFQIPRSDMSIPEEAFVLCCVSRAIPEKGWAEMILAVGHARTLSGLDIRLILVGNGPVYDDYCRSGKPDFVYLAGFSENSVGHYAAADMGIMLTKFKSESFPLTIVDCLFAGKPYIASDVGDIKNMLTIGDKVAGEVIKLENWEIPIKKAAQVISDFAIDKQKYKNSLELVSELASRYRIDVVAQEYINIFKRDVSLTRSKNSIVGHP